MRCICLAEFGERIIGINYFNNWQTMEIVKRINVTYAGIAILINYTVSLAGPRRPVLAILLLITCHWLANRHLSYYFR